MSAFWGLPREGGCPHDKCVQESFRCSATVFGVPRSSRCHVASAFLGRRSCVSGEGGRRRVWLARGAGVLLLLLTASLPAHAQLQLAAIDGLVTGPDGIALAGATVTLLDRVGNPVRMVTTATDGRFRFADVQPGSYAISADAVPFHARMRDVQVGGPLPLTLTLRMSAVVSEQVQVRAAGVRDSGATSTRMTLGGDSVRNAPARVRSRGLQDVLASVPGWGSEDNGLLHVRGVDEGVLYVVDGVPAYERFDSLFGVAPDPMTVESITVSTGYIPPKFGFKSGAVVEVRSVSSVADRWAGSGEGLLASDDAVDGAAVVGGPLTGSSSLALNLGSYRSSRFLDPTHPDNLHNSGGAVTGGGEWGWRMSASSTVRAVAGVSRSRFDVPHGQVQETAGQDQRQRVGGSWQTLSWERAWSPATITTIAGYHRSSGATLDGSADDTPLFVQADRRLRRVGVLVGATHSRGRHVVKIGAEAARLSLREDFLFAVTDPDEDEADFTDAVKDFTIEHPFAFSGTGTPSLVSAYVQDSMRLADRLTIDVGVRADWSRMLALASQVSPRLGVAYRVARTGTLVRASFGRFFQPPQAENLLLASSVEARVLSPFASGSGSGSGGADLVPERQSAVETGVDQTLGPVRLDVAWWRRWVRNAADPNVFLGTTIIFPNAVAHGWASGIDVRLDVAPRRGWSGFVSYSNSRVQQAGPITGGLFLEDEVADLAEGERFTPDHDQRNVAAAGLSFVRDGFSAAANARFESGTPLQLGDEEVDELEDRPGSELVDFERGRVKPRRSLDLTFSQRVRRTAGSELRVRLSLLNVTNARLGLQLRQSVQRHSLRPWSHRSDWGCALVFEPRRTRRRTKKGP